MEHSSLQCLLTVDRSDSFPLPPRPLDSSIPLSLSSLFTNKISSYQTRNTPPVHPPKKSHLKTNTRGPRSPQTGTRPPPAQHPPRLLASSPNLSTPLLTLTIIMPAPAGPSSPPSADVVLLDEQKRARPRLVGTRLLYAISCFASLGVFLFGYVARCCLLEQRLTCR